MFEISIVSVDILTNFVLNILLCLQKLGIALDDHYYGKLWSCHYGVTSNWMCYLLLLWGKFSANYAWLICQGLLWGVFWGLSFWGFEALFWSYYVTQGLIAAIKPCVEFSEEYFLFLEYPPTSPQTDISSLGQIWHSDYCQDNRYPLFLPNTAEQKIFGISDIWGNRTQGGSGSFSKKKNHATSLSKQKY